MRADPDLTDNMGNTGLHLLIEEGEKESSPAVQALFQAGTHVDQTNKYGETPTDLLYRDYTTSRIDEENKILVNPLGFSSLKCLCALWYVDLKTFPRMRVITLCLHNCLTLSIYTDVSICRLN